MNFPNLAKQLAASAWQKPNTSSIVFNVELAEAFAEILDAEMSKANLGCATTGQMLDEIKSRVDCSYSTVFSQPVGPPCEPTRVIPRPTIEELERILAQKGENVKILLNPDGSLTTTEV